MIDDPIVSEVRRAREAHAARFHGDLDLIFQDIKRSEKELRRAGWKFAPAPRRKPAATTTRTKR
jgi:hypothetical protein